MARKLLKKIFKSMLLFLASFAESNILLHVVVNYMSAFLLTSIILWYICSVAWVVGHHGIQHKPAKNPYFSVKTEIFYSDNIFKICPN